MLVIEDGGAPALTALAMLKIIYFGEVGLNYSHQTVMVAAVAAVLLVEAPLSIARAETPSADGIGSVPAQATASIPNGLPSGAPPECAQYDKLQTRATAAMLNTPICATIAPDLGGLRKALADSGFGISVQANVSYGYDVLGHNAKPVTYSKQDPQWVGIGTATLTYDLNRIGFAGDSQFTFQASGSRANYELGSVNTNYMKILAINQRFYGGQVEVQYGYYSLMDQFYGITLGGNAAMAA